MNTKTITIFVLVMSLVISGCGQGQSVEPTMTPVQVSTPTQTPEPTTTPTPTIIPTITPSLTPTPHTPNPEADKLLKEAFSFSTQGEDEKAIETYTKAIEADPLFGQPYFNRGAIYADHRELEKALADFNKGLELDPTNALGYTSRAQVYIELDKLDEAQKDLKSLINLAESDDEVKRALNIAGHIYNIQDEPFLALSAYTAALEIDEFDVSALLSRGQIYLNQGDWLRAFSDLFLARQTVDDPEFRQAINDILIKVYPEGTSLEEAIKASEPHYYKAIEYDKAGDYKNASESLSMAIEIDPLNPEYYFQRGLEFARNGNLLPAITDMSYVVAFGPFEPRGYYWRGLMESDLGLAAESIADMEKALELDLNSDAKTKANQVLKDMRQLQKSCQFTAFESVNDTEKPTFLFTFNGPPNTDFTVAVLSRVTGDGYTMKAKTPQNGVTPTGIEYELGADEATPIQLDIHVLAGNCQLLKTVIWPEIDILALLSGDNP